MSYPTFYLFRAGQKTNVLDFDGPVEIEAWDAFLAKYSPKYMEYLEDHPEATPELLKEKPETVWFIGKYVIINKSLINFYT